MRSDDRLKESDAPGTVSLASSLVDRTLRKLRAGINIGLDVTQEGVLRINGPNALSNLIDAESTAAFLRLGAYTDTIPLPIRLVDDVVLEPPRSP